jgi:hypothetical protein
LFGWDWYHRDLIVYPATSIIRFFVDVLVVTTSLMFLASSQHEVLWFVFLAVMFWLYVLWDAVNIWEHPKFFDRLGELVSDFRRVLQEYRSGGRDRRELLDPITNVLLGLLSHRTCLCCLSFSGPRLVVRDCIGCFRSVQRFHRVAGRQLSAAGRKAFGLLD